MGDWANALMTGIGAAANTGASIIGDEMKEQQRIDAEQRAADTRLDTEQRLMAMKEAMGARAAERFSNVVKAKASEELPVEAQTVPQTGITRDSANAVGTGPGFEMDATKAAATIRQWQAVRDNPNATPEQKADAEGIIAQITRQVDAQVELNNKAVEGKTRKRTTSEAAHAALDETLQSDPLAYIAGTGMLGSVLKDEATTKAADLKERLAAAEADRKERQAKEDRESAERRAAGHDEQRDRAAELRFEAMMQRLEAGQSGKSGQKSAMVQNLEWLRDNLGFTPEQLGDYVTEKKHLAPEDIAAKLLSADKFGDLTPETAMERAMQLVAARDKLAKGGSSSSSSSSTGKTLNYDPKTGKFN
jgi:hypothetical protein